MQALCQAPVGMPRRLLDLHHPQHELSGENDGKELQLEPGKVSHRVCRESGATKGAAPTRLVGIGQDRISGL